MHTNLVISPTTICDQFICHILYISHVIIMQNNIYFYLNV